LSFINFPVRFGRYILLDKIASGGMAEVYRAKTSGAEDFQRLVAIKCMRPELTLNDQFITMFVDEAKLASSLTHPNIVQINELGRVGNQLFIAMELINGRDLRHILSRSKETQIQIPVGFAAYVIAKAAEALDYAHAMKSLDGRPLKLVHRDISPQNILVTYDGQVKLVDFGIARAEERRTETQAGQLKGKLAYMAPEQTLGGAELDHRVDIFALGAVFYELLTAQQLFSGDDPIEIVEKIRGGNLPGARETRPEVPEPVDLLIKKCLARKPVDRWESAGEISDALARYLVVEDTVVGPRYAGKLMGQLYRQEIEEIGGRLKHFMTLTERDCVFTAATGVTEIYKPATSSAATAPELTGARLSGSAEKQPAPTEILSAEQLGVKSASGASTVATFSAGKRPNAVTWIAFGVTVISLLVAVLALVIRARRAPEPPRPPPVAAVAPVAAPPPVEEPPAPAPAPAPVIAPPVAVTSSAPPPAAKKSVAAKAKSGYITVGHKGTREAKVFIDGGDAGYSPLMGIKVPAGKHHIEVVEMLGDKPGRTVKRDITVGPGHTETAPLKVIVGFGG
jgi:eukaryotic-like serine/threonine-protein kinase